MELDREGTVRLLGVILAGTPKLAGAACRARPGLFDDQLAGEGASV